MRAFWTSLLLLAALLTAVGLHTAFLTHRFSVMEQSLRTLPTKKTDYEKMTDAERRAWGEVLADIADTWTRGERLRFCTMRHSSSLEFDKAFDVGISFYESGEYAEYLAQLAAAKTALRQLIFEEGLSMGNLM